VSVGAFTVYADIVNAFDKEAQRLLIEMATDISFALDNFASEERQRLSLIALEDSEQRFRCMIEQSIAGVCIIQDDRFNYVNPRFEEILGYPVGDGLVGRSPLEIVSPKDRSTVSDHLCALRDGTTHAVSYVYTALRNDGSIVEVGFNNSSVNYLGRPAIIGLMQDISERKIAEEHIRRYTEKLQNSFMQTVGLATTLSEIRDPYTAGHERRVAVIAVAIGSEMGLDELRLVGLKVGGYLHDVGKTAIPVEILSKPGKISPIEYELIKTHPRAGYEVLKEVDFPWPVAEIALQHHERMDGSGYPQGLKGESIILEARIMAVADVLEAMASHRPYRPGLGIDKALEEIEQGRGSSYDPVVTDACLRLFREQGYKLQE
jgi:PAS domain S-box-containing protein/putative nucleotidyltransferase with HDIG domain